MIKILTDSTCDLPVALLRRHDIRLIPINIQFGTETYEEGVTMDRPSFYRKVDELQMIPTTSQPSAGRFAEVYRELAAGGAGTILSIHITSKLSGTYQSAELARQMVADEVTVYTFDSASGSAGLGFMALESARMAAAGQKVMDILQRLKELRLRMRLIFTMADLRYAQMSGRVGKLKGTLASVLNVKPIVGMEDGVIDVVAQVRTRNKAVEKIVDMMKDAIGTTEPANLAVIHAEALQEGQKLLERVQRMFNCQDTFIEDLAISLAANLGPGTLGLVAYQV
ncbi:MAG: DegV family protein [Chloroflexi bacterium]|nr:DegV family protein [Chloroflexota bacterium]